MVALRLVVALASLALVGVVVGSWLCWWVLLGCCVGGVRVVLGWWLVSCGVVSLVSLGVLWGACGNLPHPPHSIQSMTYYPLSVAIVELTGTKPVSLTI